MTTVRHKALARIPAAALLDALGDGAIVCDGFARVLGANRRACETLSIVDRDLASLHAVFEQPQLVHEALRRATLTTQEIPVRLDAKAGLSNLRVGVRMLEASGDDGNDYFLLRLRGTRSVTRQIMSLHKRLSETAEAKEALEHERDELRSVVDTTIPKLQVLSYKDALTGLGNRRYFDHWLEKAWQRSIDQDVAIAVIYLDVDHFKIYNDAYGHVRGDETLTMIATVLARNAARDGDHACRIGGEEFAFLLPGTDLRGAFNVADRTRCEVEALGLPHPSDPCVSVSLGVGTITPRRGDRARDFLERVDAALYRAKRMGRNRVEFVTAIDGSGIAG